MFSSGYVCEMSRSKGQPAYAVSHEEIQGARNGARVVLDDAHDRLRAPDEERRLELYFRAAADRADLQICSARAEHLDPLGDHLWEPDEIARDVGADAARPLAHEVEALPPVGRPGPKKTAALPVVIARCRDRRRRRRAGCGRRARRTCPR